MKRIAKKSAKKVVVKSVVQKTKEISMLMTSEFPIGMKFTTKGDFGDVTFQILRRISLLPYKPKVGYTVKESNTGNCLEVKEIRFSKKASYRPLLAGKIGMHGGTWYMRIPEL